MAKQGVRRDRAAVSRRSLLGSLGLASAYGLAKTFGIAPPSLWAASGGEDAAEPFLAGH